MSVKISVAFLPRFLELKLAARFPYPTALSVLPLSSLSLSGSEVIPCLAMYRD